MFSSCQLLLIHANKFSCVFYQQILWISVLTTGYFHDIWGTFWWHMRYGFTIYEVRFHDTWGTLWWHMRYTFMTYEVRFHDIWGTPVDWIFYKNQQPKAPFHTPLTRSLTDPLTDPLTILTKKYITLFLTASTTPPKGGNPPSQSLPAASGLPSPQGQAPRPQAVFTPKSLTRYASLGRYALPEINLWQKPQPSWIAPYLAHQRISVPGLHMAQNRNLDGWCN